MLTHSVFRSRFLLPLTLLVLLLPAGLIRAQGADDILPSDGTDDLTKEGRDEPTKRNVGKLLKGPDENGLAFDVKNQKHKDALDYEARWVAYRFTWPDHQDAKPGEPSKGIDVLFRAYEGDLAQISKNAKFGKVIGPLYCQKLIKFALEVVDRTRKPIAQINGARVLARLVDKTDKVEDILARLAPAETGKPAVLNELAEALVSALSHKNDAVKYYAARGLGDVLRVNGLATKDKLTAETEQKATQALADLILRKVDFVKDTPEPEIDGYRALRREAIRALSHEHTPALGEKNRPALVLLKAMAGEGLLPAVRSDERVEAALGVALMRPDADKNYQPDYAAYQIAYCLADLARRSKVVDAEKKRPWKLLAARLTDALYAMKAKSANATVSKLVDDMTKLITTRLEEGSADVPFARFLEGLPKQPPVPSLFRDDPKSTVTFTPDPTEKEKKDEKDKTDEKDK